MHAKSWCGHDDASDTEILLFIPAVFQLYISIVYLRIRFIIIWI